MKRNQRFVFVLFLIFLIYLVYQYAQSYDFYAGMRTDLEKMTLKVENLKAERTALEETLEYVGTPTFIEQVAREKLGLVKEGETLLVIIEE